MSETNLHENRTISVAIEDEMKKSYLDYAMSVIVSRAIPDVRDGLKPVHRRILYSMYDTGVHYNKPYRKSARVVGDVIGKYHPHGDQAIYDSMVRMAQSFSLRDTLIDGQGNFGSMDGDSPAAMRYTEARLTKLAHNLLEDLDKDTVDFQPNYDGSEHEPTVLPAIFPNILVNGSGGIAVGMATNMPPHNLGEVLDACCLYVDNNDITIEELMEVVKGPDFPTAGIIIGTSGVKSALMTGRGSVMMRGRAEFEKIGNKEAIIITEIPYQVNKAKLVERIAELVNEKRIEGITDLRDESNKAGVRVVVELRRDVIPDIILNQLYSFTPLQTSFGVNNLVLNDGRPLQMNLKDIITAFVKFREVVITRRTNYLLNKARNRAHILLGLSIAVANIDEVIALIKASANPLEAKESLMAKDWKADNVEALIRLIGSDSNALVNGACRLTEEQAKAILDMRLHRLTGLEQDRISGDLKEIALEIQGYIDILSSRTKLLEILKSELLLVKENFATPRRTEIQIDVNELDMEDLIQKEDMVVTVTHEGYIKRVPLSTYKAQRRGGKGRMAVNMKDEDFTVEMFISTTHTPILYFSNFGRVYRLKVYKLPLGNPQAKGRALVNILPLSEGEKITNVMPLPEDENEWDNLNIMFATKFGCIRRNDFTDFHSIQSNGKIAIKLDEGDSLIGVNLCKESDHILLSAHSGKCLRFPVEAVRVFKGRSSSGVRGIRLTDNDHLISMSVLHGAEIEMTIRDEYLKIPVETRIALQKLKDEVQINELLASIESPLEKAKILDLALNEEFILTVTENGFGKRTSAYEYRITNRGGSGIVNIITSGKNGGVVASLPVYEDDQIMIVTNKGTMLRSSISNIRIQGRNTKGVTIQRTDVDEQVVTVARIAEGDNAASEVGPEGEMSEENNE